MDDDETGIVKLVRSGRGNNGRFVDFFVEWCKITMDGFVGMILKGPNKDVVKNGRSEQHWNSERMLLEGGRGTMCAIILFGSVPLYLIRHFLCWKFQVSKEGEVYEVPIEVAKMSTLVATTIDDDADDEDEVREIPLPNVKDSVLSKVIEYCTHYKEEPMTAIQTPLKSSKIEELVQPWYAKFVQVEQSLLFELVTAANFMDIKPLLDLTCLAVSVLIKGKQASELRAIFNISNDFTPEEEAQVREENKWVEHPNGG
jgi:S-phase kinase-associated protein 1